MTWTELFKIALDEQTAGRRTIELTMPGKWGKRTHILLCGEGSPRGRILTDTVGHDGGKRRLLVRFDVEDILRYAAPLAKAELDSGRVVLAVRDTSEGGGVAA